ncbi:MAG: acetylesterase, partial [Fuerstiella sp.]|nr:acetylesterase [Fuerstiella sp.]
VAFLLFHPGRIGNVSGMLGRSLDDVDRDLLYDAVRAVLQNEDGRARGTISSVYDLLTWEEVEPLLPAVYKAVVEPAPSGVMFASGIRLRGLELLARYRIEEGLPLCVPLMDIQNWGKKKRIASCLKILKLYGGAARSQLPALRELEQQLKSHKEAKALAELTREVQNVISDIDNATDVPELRRLPLIAK